MSVRLTEGAIAVSGSGWAGMDLLLVRVGGESRAWHRVRPGPEGRSRPGAGPGPGGWSWSSGDCHTRIPGISTAVPPQLLGYNPS